MKKAEQDNPSKKKQQAKMVHLIPKRVQCPLKGLLKDLEKIDQELEAHWKMETNHEKAASSTISDPKNDTDSSGITQ